MPREPATHDNPSVKRCPYCAEEIQDEAIKCRYCGMDLSQTAPAPASASTVSFTHSGYRFVLGQGLTEYSIWDRQAPAEPIARYELSEAGWASAWRDFAAREPQAVGVGGGEGGSPFAVGQAGTRRPGPITSAGVIEIILGGLALLVGVAISLADEAATGLPRNAAVIAGVLTVLQGGLDILAGILILRGSSSGRVLGFVMGGIGVAAALFTIGSGAPAGVIGLVLRIVVIVLLAQGGAWFKQRAAP